MQYTVHHLLHELEEYLKYIGVHIVDVKITEERYASITSSSGYGNVYAVNIKFQCSEDEIEYFRPVIQNVEISEGPVYDSIIVNQCEKWNLNPVQASSFEKIIMCTTRFYVSPDYDVNRCTFLNDIKKATEPLFLAKESKMFDDEVEKMLTEKDYEDKPS